jgi:hypothetical protein
MLRHPFIFAPLLGGAVGDLVGGIRSHRRCTSKVVWLRGSRLSTCLPAAPTGRVQRPRLSAEIVIRAWEYQHTRKHHRVLSVASTVAGPAKEERPWHEGRICAAARRCRWSSPGPGRASRVGHTAQASLRRPAARRLHAPGLSAYHGLRCCSGLGARRFRLTARAAAATGVCPLPLPPGAQGGAGRYEHGSGRHDSHRMRSGDPGRRRTGTRGSYKVQVGTGGEIHVNDEPIGVLRRLKSQDGGDQHS